MHYLGTKWVCIWNLRYQDESVQISKHKYVHLETH